VGERVSCSVCGTTVAGDPPLTWSSSTGPRGLTYVCERCTRDQVRAIEAKLDEQWW
jgi:hypothetical protein